MDREGLRKGWGRGDPTRWEPRDAARDAGRLSISFELVWGPGVTGWWQPGQWEVFGVLGGRVSPWGRGGGPRVAPTVPPRGEVMSARLIASGAERWPRPRGHPKRCPAGAGAAGAAEARACPPCTEWARRGTCATARGVPDPRSAGHGVPSGTQSHAAGRSPPRRRTPKIAFAQVACGAVWRWKEAEGRRSAGARGAGARTPTPAARPPEGPRVGSRVPRLALPGSGGSPVAL